MQRGPPTPQPFDQIISTGALLNQELLAKGLPARMVQ